MNKARRRATFLRAWDQIRVVKLCKQNLIQD